MPSRWELLFRFADETWIGYGIKSEKFRTWVCATVRHAELTKLLHRLDLITAVTAAGILLE